MAVKQTNKTCRLTLKVETGQTSSGDAAYTNRNISNINPEITDDDLLTVGNTIGALQTYPMGGIVRTDAAYLVEE